MFRNSFKNENYTLTFMKMVSLSFLIFLFINQVHSQDSNLSISSKKALMGYMKNDYDFINSYLRTGNDYSDLGIGFVENQILLISEALNSFPKYRGLSYRGVCISNNRIADKYLMEDNIITIPSFLSSSKNKNIAMCYIDGEAGCTPILMIIKSKSGRGLSKFAKINFGINSSQYLEEEVIFDFGLEFKIKKIKNERHDFFGEIYIVQMDELNY